MVGQSSDVVRQVLVLVRQVSDVVRRNSVLVRQVSDVVRNYADVVRQDRAQGETFLVLLGFGKVLVIVG